MQTHPIPNLSFTFNHLTGPPSLKKGTVAHENASKRYVFATVPRIAGDVDVSELGDKAARVNITLPQRILRAVDAHARKQGETRSGFLARAALDAMRKPA
jgi:hypothetical protein